MDDMREIVTVEQVEHLFRLLAIALPLVGAAVGAAWGARRRLAARGAGAGFLIGLLGPANWLLWRIYNALTDRMGLDSVKNLLVNLALFVVLGAGAGFAYGVLYRRRSVATAPPEPPAGGPTPG